MADHNKYRIYNSITKFFITALCMYFELLDIVKTFDMFSLFKKEITNRDNLEYNINNILFFTFLM